MKILFLLLPLLFTAPAFAQTEAECKAKVESILKSQTPPKDYKNWSRVPSTRACGILLMHDHIEGEKYLDITRGTINMGTEKRPNMKYVTVYLLYFRKEEKGIE
jgi:hypothetical protein